MHLKLSVLKKTLNHSLGILSMFSLLFLFSFKVAAQDLTEAQRIERCQNNKNRLAELEVQLKAVNTEISQTWTKQEVENARDKMIFVKKSTTLKKPPIEGTDDYIRLMAIAEEYDLNYFGYKNCLHVGEISFKDCLKRLEILITKKIDKVLSAPSKKAELVVKKNEIEKQMSKHRTNLIALGCDRKLSPGGGSLKLVGPELLGKSRKESYNAVVYTEYEYSNNSATLTIQGDPPDRKMIKWQFEGIPASLSPGDSVEITITGSLQINKGGDIQPWPSAGVRATGLTLISGENAYVSVKQNRDGKYVFKVPANTKSCTIEIGADWGLGTFARYRYEK